MSALRQSEVDAGSWAAFERYAAKTEREASIAFAYEVQGYLACLVERHGLEHGAAVAKVIGLLELWLQAQAKA